MAYPAVLSTLITNPVFLADPTLVAVAWEAALDAFDPDADIPTILSIANALSRLAKRAPVPAPIVAQLCDLLESPRDVRGILSEVLLAVPTLSTESLRALLTRSSSVTLHAGVACHPNADITVWRRIVALHPSDLRPGCPVLTISLVLAQHRPACTHPEIRALLWQRLDDPAIVTKLAQTATVEELPRLLHDVAIDPRPKVIDALLAACDTLPRRRLARLEPHHVAPLLRASTAEARARAIALLARLTPPAPQRHVRRSHRVR